MNYGHFMALDLCLNGWDHKKWCLVFCFSHNIVQDKEDSNARSSSHSTYVFVPRYCSWQPKMSPETSATTCSWTKVKHDRGGWCMEDQGVEREKSLFWALCRDTAWPIEVKGMNEAIHCTLWKSSCWASNEGGPICTYRRAQTSDLENYPGSTLGQSPQQQAGVRMETRRFNQCLAASSTEQSSLCIEWTPCEIDVEGHPHFFKGEKLPTIVPCENIQALSPSFKGVGCCPLDFFSQRPVCLSYICYLSDYPTYTLIRLGACAETC